MKRFGSVAGAAVLIGLCGLVATGCRGRTARPTVDTVPLTEVGGGELPGDKALGSRFDEGQRITDVNLDNVLFDYDSFQIRDSELPKIRAAADYMKANPAVRLVVEGHCDERGSREYNMALGEHRALAVRAQLIGLGIDGSRIQTRSFGEEQPADPGHTQEAWRVNRRGVFALYR